MAAAIRAPSASGFAPAAGTDQATVMIMMSNIPVQRTTRSAGSNGLLDS
jgi:hypothetical protein